MQTTTDDATDKMDSNKEPWLAAGFSWLLPGAGQFYCGHWRAGIVLMLLAGLLNTMLITFLLYPQIPTMAFIAACLCGVTLLIGASASAFRTARKQNTAELEAARTAREDPWLAVFLSLILPGAGHLYLRKRVAGVSLIIVFLLLCLEGRGSIHAWIAVILLRALVPFHAYVASPAHHRVSKRRSISLVVVLLCLFSLGSIPTSAVITSNGLQLRIADDGSMAPTITKGACVVVDRVTHRWAEPAVGDVVLLVSPRRVLRVPRLTMRRVVAVGGETVRVRDEVLHVEGRSGELRETPYAFPRVRSTADFYYYGAHMPHHVPEGCYFVVGESSAPTVDSRHYEAVRRRNVIGKVVRVLWPLNAPPLCGEKAR